MPLTEEIFSPEFADEVALWPVGCPFCLTNVRAGVVTLSEYLKRKMKASSEVSESFVCPSCSLNQLRYVQIQIQIEGII